MFERYSCSFSPPIRLAKVFREGCVGYPRRYTIRRSNGAQSRVRTDRSCLPTTSPRGIPARYKWPVRRLIIGTCRTNTWILGIPDTVTLGMFAFGWQSPPPLPPGLSRSFLVHCSAAAALITILPPPGHPLSDRPPAQLCLPMRLPLTRWHSEQTPLVRESR